MKKPKIQSPEKILKRIKSLGLKLDQTTGGSHCDHIEKVKINNKFLNRYNVVSTEGLIVPILDPSLFLKTVLMTEESLEVKLFS